MCDSEVKTRCVLGLNIFYPNKPKLSLRVKQQLH